MTKRYDHENTFARIYESSFWSGMGAPRSGTGSTREAALPYVDQVKKFIDSHKIQSVLDIGHGDWEMWGDYRFVNVAYVGVDVYEKLTDELQNRFGTSGVQFLPRNAVTDELPNAQLCITKDVLQHLPTTEIKTILGKMSRYQYLIICNDFYKFEMRDSIRAVRRFISIRERILKIKRRENPLFWKLKKTNSEIQIGDHRCLDFDKPMFSDLLITHRLKQTFDFDGKDIKRPNITKRIYFYEKI
jgi:hypothetical protein